MRTLIAVIVAFFSLTMLPPVPAAHSGSGDKNSFTKHFSETLFVISDKGQISIELLLDEKEYKIGKDVIGIVVHDTHDEDVEGAKVDSSLVLPEGMKLIQPTKEKGGGLYTIPSLELPKEGAWKLHISVKKKKVDDSAVFIFPDITRTLLPAGKYSQEDLRRK